MLIAAAAIASRRGMCHTLSAAHDHAIFARSYAQQALLIRMADDAIDVRSGQSRNPRAANDQREIDRCCGSKSWIFGIDAAEIAEIRGWSWYASAAHDHAILDKS